MRRKLSSHRRPVVEYWRLSADGEINVLTVSRGHPDDNRTVEGCVVVVAIERFGEKCGGITIEPAKRASCGVAAQC